MGSLKPRHTAFVLCSVVTATALMSDIGCSDSGSTSGSGGKGDAAGDVIIVPYPAPREQDASSLSDAGEGDGAPLADGGQESKPGPACDLHKPFGNPVLVPKVNTPGTGTGTFSSDELTIYTVNSSVNRFHIYTATRSTVADDFGAFTLLKNVNNGTDRGDFDPYLSADGLELYFASERGGTGTSGLIDLFVASRTSVLADFELPTSLANLNTMALDVAPAIVADKSVLYFASSGYGGPDGGIICKAVRSGGTYISPRRVLLGNTTGDGTPVPSADDLMLFFNSSREGSKGNADIWVSTHSKAADTFAPPTNAGDVAALNSTWNEHPTWLSPDGCRLYLESDRPAPAGTSDYNLYVATRPR